MLALHDLMQILYDSCKIMDFLATFWPFLILHLISLFWKAPLYAVSTSQLQNWSFGRVLAMGAKHRTLTWDDLQVCTEMCRSESQPRRGIYMWSRGTHFSHLLPPISMTRPCNGRTHENNSVELTRCSTCSGSSDRGPPLKKKNQINHHKNYEIWEKMEYCLICIQAKSTRNFGWKCI